MQNRKLIIFVLILLAVFILVGCGVAAAPTFEPPAAQQRSPEIPASLDASGQPAPTALAATSVIVYQTGPDTITTSCLKNRF
jgi:hypothetical protein